MIQLITVYMVVVISVFCVMAFLGSRMSDKTPTRNKILGILRSECNGIITYEPLTSIDVVHLEFMVDAGLIKEIDSKLHITASGLSVKNNA